jgi:hypothetical protein
MTSARSAPLGDPVAEGVRIAAAATDRSLPLRVAGGVGVAMRCSSASRPPLKRAYADVDLVTLGSARKSTTELIVSLGYEPDREFNTLHGDRRLLFWEDTNGRQLDVFVDEANLCHTIDFRHRLEFEASTLALADLLVMKLQVVETNEKDLLDICALMADHELTQDESGINHAYISRLTGHDWGLWKTFSTVTGRASQFARTLNGLDAREKVVERLERLQEALDAAPKSRAWKLRAKLGERKRWYALPEEVR